MKERISHRETTRPRTITRRFLLRTAGLLTLPVFFRKDTGEPEPKPDYDVLAIMAGVEKELFDVFEQVERGEFPVENNPVPEWERTGSDVLIAIGSDASDVENELKNYWNKILRSFLPGTHIHVVSTAGTKAILENKLRTSRPHLEFSVYELPLRDFNENIYSRDMIFSSGRKDEGGRFIIYTGKLDRLSMPASPDNHSWMYAFGDELLASGYPERFVSKPIPLRCEGGDLQITRLPNGKTALILGDANFRANVGAVMSGANANGREGRNANFDYSYLMTKFAYQKFFSVDDCIILDDKGILKDLPGSTINQWVDPGRSGFYHADMCVRTAVDPNGRYVAFVTSTDTEKTRIAEKDVRHLRNIRLQFEGLGFDIVELPCGRFPSLNYTNVLIFKPQDGPATVMLPCYGERSLDDEAARLYESRGFKIIRTDMSDRLRSEEEIRKGGSLHCLVDVLS